MVEDARNYILDCRQAGEGINPNVVGELIGTNLRASIQQFVSDTLDSAGRSYSVSKPKGGQNIEAGFAKLLQKIYEPEEAPNPEEPGWWSAGKSLRCQNPGCTLPLVPKRTGNRWETEAQYRGRKYCNAACTGKARRSTTEKKGQKA